ncbi:RsmE family RNA methyltransferase [Pelagicoccus mobilis]|uniref:Ribosomal RNA small subunit methyltransferase E n=1 Tax=Pelagicoccus mobilis TaxID=415221 RepID=A0A934S2N1_9BACT|nr:RsmE family RNA methyltransferase [Pelagicoccus mobilis]MBK1879526.1 16S rRNA (uracil(1498)-N(3))-methyltransferase [Pelagicoccus mobilis]
MPDFRCFCENLPDSIGSLVDLSPEESNHLVAANRAREGDPVRVFDGKGLECDARLTNANKRKATLTLETIQRVPHPPFRIALGQALPKGKLIESIIKKATEIGIQEVYPLSSSRVESKIDPKKASSKSAKWELAALEGAKQSGNPRPAEVHQVCSLPELLDLSQSYELKLIASLEEQAVSLKQHLARFSSSQNGKSPKSAIWLIGPEGDFTPEEYEQAYQAGFLPTTLGPHVMRSETAAIHALSITHYELNSFSNGE